MSVEIEAERDRWKAECLKWAEATGMAIKGSVTVGQENDRMERRISLLEDALREIDKLAYSHVKGAMQKAQQIARAALNGEKPPTP